MTQAFTKKYVIVTTTQKICYKKVQNWTNKFITIQLKIGQY